MKTKNLSIIVLTCMLLIGCAAISRISDEMRLPSPLDTDEEFITVSYKVLETAAITYDTFMNSVKDLYERGLISPDDRMKIMKYSISFYEVYIESTDLLFAFAKTKDAANREKIVALLKEVNEIIIKMMQERCPQ